MRSILVVVDGTERTDHALRTAVERADGENAGLVVVNVTPEEEYWRKQDAVNGVGARTGEGYRWTARQAEDSARRAAERSARLAVGDRDVVWTAVGAVGVPRTVVLAVAAEYDCEEILVAVSKPQWFGLRRTFERKLGAAFDGLVTAVPTTTAGSGDGVAPVPEPEV